MLVRRFLLAVVVLVWLPINGWADEWRNTEIAGMNVRLYVPDTEPMIAGKRALMVSLHGCKQKNEDLQQRGNWAATADEYGMVVALPQVRVGVYAECWDYYGCDAFGKPLAQTRDNRHNGELLSLVRALLADEDLNIDRNQVYLSGLSSGGGQTMVTGCLAPEVFAGLGINAGPTVGTGAHQIFSVATTLARAKALCLEYAGDHRADFATQLTSVIYGDRDHTCAQGYNELNADVMAAVYGASTKSTFSVAELAGHQPRGEGWLWSDAEGPRVSLIKVLGMGHAWPAGSGPGGEVRWVASQGVNYPAYITAFFFANNRRVSVAPTLEATIVVAERVATVSGRVTGSERAEVTIRIDGVVAPFSENRDNVPLDDGAFRQQFGPLPNDNVYRTILVASDPNTSSTSMTLPDFDVGNPQHPPLIEEVIAVVEGDCLHLHGRVSDRDGDLQKVLVSVDEGGPLQATVQDETWALDATCGLDEGSHRAVVTAVDAGGLKSDPVTKEVRIAPPYEKVTDTLTGHSIARRFQYYPGQGYGAADATYVELLQQHGMSQEFPLYGYQGRWYADSANLESDRTTESRLRARLIGLLKEGLPAAESAHGDPADVNRLGRLPLVELIKRADQGGMLFDGKTSN